jgi:hypothetical protein
MSPSSREKSAFFLANGKKDFKSMPMGAMNAHSFFVATMSKMESKWSKPHGVRTKKRKEAEQEQLQWIDKVLQDRLRGYPCNPKMKIGIGPVQLHHCAPPCWKNANGLRHAIEMQHLDKQMAQRRRNRQMEVQATRKGRQHLAGCSSCDDFYG